MNEIHPWKGDAPGAVVSELDKDGRKRCAYGLWRWLGGRWRVLEGPTQG